MKLYRFSPIQDQAALMAAIEHIHFSCYTLCKQAMGEYYPNAGNMGVFCHYDDEYERLIKLRESITEPSDNVNQKYYRLYESIVIPARDDVPETTYTHLYIRKPDPYRYHVGDVDFFLEPEQYQELKQSMLNGRVINGARVFDRPDLDMIELYHPDIDALGYISTARMSQAVRAKIILPS